MASILKQRATSVDNDAEFLLLAKSKMPLSIQQQLRCRTLATFFEEMEEVLLRVMDEEQAKSQLPKASNKTRTSGDSRRRRSGGG